MNPTFLNWLRETVQRLFIKSPKFFMIWQIVSGALMFLSGVPYILTTLGVHLSEPLATMSNKAVTFGAAGALFMSSLTVKTPTVAQTESGEAVKVTDDKKMPFTSKAEAKAVTETVPPPPVSHDVPDKVDK